MLGRASGFADSSSFIPEANCGRRGGGRHYVTWKLNSKQYLAVFFGEEKEEGGGAESEEEMRHLCMKFH